MYGELLTLYGSPAALRVLCTVDSMQIMLLVKCFAQAAVHRLLVLLCSRTSHGLSTALLCPGYSAALTNSTPRLSKQQGQSRQV